MVHHGGDSLLFRGQRLAPLAAQGGADPPGTRSFPDENTFDGDLVAPFVSAVWASTGVFEDNSYHRLAVYDDLFQSKYYRQR